MSFGPERTTAFLDRGLHIASSLHDRALIYICGWHGELCSQTMISGSDHEPMQ